jgi:2-hydroxy-3-oxopropionate reductase
MTTIGFIGLGIMGAPMAANLVDAGFPVIGYNRSPAAVEALVARGGKAAANVGEVTANADVVITMLPDSPDVEAVLLGSDGVLSASREGQLVIDMSTVTPATAVRVAAEARARGVGALDAPVSGGEAGAIEGSLSIMVGGERADFERAQPVFRAVGKTIELLGPAGSGQATKAANQLLVGGIIALVSEAMVLLGASDVDVAAALRVLGGGLAGNKVLERKGEAMLARSFKPGFRIDLHHKDYGIVLDAARETGVALPVTGVVAQLMAAARAQGLGGSDHSALLTVVESLSARG